jgi:hypothetical protein
MEADPAGARKRDDRKPQRPQGEDGVKMRAVVAPRTMPLPRRFERSKLQYVTAALVVMALGLASRKVPGLFPAVLGKYPGDALWALMVFLGWGVVQPTAGTWRLATAAALTACAIELSQLYQAPWIDSIRSTPLGHLVLGSTFFWGDLLAYIAGVAIGALGDGWWSNRRPHHSSACGPGGLPPGSSGPNPGPRG